MRRFVETMSQDNHSGPKANFLEDKAGPFVLEVPGLTSPLLLFAFRSQNSTFPAVTLLTRVKFSFPVAQLFMSSAAVWIFYGIFSK